jgi:hypothetical protein
MKTHPTIHTISTRWRTKKSGRRVGSGDIIKGMEEKTRQNRNAVKAE